MKGLQQVVDRGTTMNVGDSARGEGGSGGPGDMEETKRDLTYITVTKVTQAVRPTLFPPPSILNF